LKACDIFDEVFPVVQMRPCFLHVSVIGLKPNGGSCFVTESVTPSRSPRSIAFDIVARKTNDGADGRAGNKDDVRLVL
jgi:hypothetical protein